MWLLKFDFWFAIDGDAASFFLPLFLFSPALFVLFICLSLIIMKKWLKRKKEMEITSIALLCRLIFFFSLFGISKWYHRIYERF